MKRFLAMFCAVLITAVAVNVNAGPKLDGVKCPVSGRKVLADNISAVLDALMNSPRRRPSLLLKQTIN